LIKRVLLFTVAGNLFFSQVNSILYVVPCFHPFLDQYIRRVLSIPDTSPVVRIRRLFSVPFFITLFSITTHIAMSMSIGLGQYLIIVSPFDGMSP
jgi:hypothetical protein